jgi:signal transduction histidine kinase
MLSGRDVTRVHVITALGLMTLAAVLLRLAFFDYSPGSELFHPHGYCYLWQPDLVAAHVVADGLIGTAYVAISLTLIHLVRRARRQLPFSWMFVAFGGFIIACGATHFVEIWTLWQPVFWLAADVKIITAVASVATAVLLPPLVPRVLGVVSAAQLSEQRRVELEQAHAELERRVAERTVELERALERAQRASEAREAFLGTVSHELRTPLNAILGWSRMVLKNSADHAFVRRGLEVIDRNARAQAQLVEDVLDISRLTREGGLRLLPEPTDLTRLLRDCVDSVRPAAEGKQIALEAAWPAGPVQLTGDPRRLRQLLCNVLVNAVKFTPEGGRVGVALRVDDGQAVVDVRDTGIGIDRAFLPRVFDRFAQADCAATRAQPGLGIGLTIAHQLAELHGGCISAHSDGPGCGALFRIELPLHTDSVVTH